MSKSITEVQGFEVLNKQIQRLGKDSLKRREILKILRQGAKATVRAAKNEAPVSKAIHTVSGKNRVYQRISPGNLKKSIGAVTGRSKTVPTIYVKARKTKAFNGYYGPIVIRGVKKGKFGSKFKGNPFIDRAYNQTRGQVTAVTEKSVARYVQKQIDKLSNNA